jgi:tetratricopeptide (TPR) repeat protein
MHFSRKIHKTLLSVAWIFFFLYSLAGCVAQLDNSRVYSLNLDAKQYYLLGVQYSREKNPDEAIKAFTRSIAASPSAAAYNERCAEYIRKGLYDAAIADASKAIYFSPRYPAPYFNRGNSYFKKEDYSGALRDYSKAIELDSAQAEFYFNSGLAHFKMGQQDAAADQYRKAIAADPKYYAAYYNLAAHFSARKDIARALEFLEKAVKAGFVDAELMKKDPGLDNIRRTARFRFLLQKLEKK